ncbi:Y-family DNA polymerase [Rhodopirellula sp. JC639]|uniref:Y-family DNA polymerase n=1 Tax=Stieleria mannarensis TaxID=2755585 RepID=UPI001601DE68|nr:DNA polymerase Y family protein [Rhodopirellula sp. JC639]
MKRLLSIWLRNWPIQRLQSEWHRDQTPEPLPSDRSDRPHAESPSTAPPNSRPLILWKNDHRRGRMVVACCAAARPLGVRPGIAIAQATELAGASGVTPISIEHDSIADSIALDRIADALQHRISPLVAIESLGKRPWAGQILLESDTLFCDLSGVTHLFDDEAGILEATRRTLAEFGLVGKLAIADHAAAAWALAHYHPRDTYISDRGADDLRDLSVNALRIETETKHTLDRLGIETVGQLLRLPRGGLARRLGDGIVKRIAEVLGEVEVPLEIHHAEQQHHSTHDLEYPTEDREILMDRVGRLTEDIVASLATAQRGALRVACRLELVERAPLTTVIGMFAPTQDAEHLHGLIHASLEALRIQAPITKITLSVLSSGPLRTQQSTLFAEDAFALDNDSVSDRSLARLVDTLTGRLGREAVLGVRLSENPLPEKAFRTYSLTDHRTRQALQRLPAKQAAPSSTARHRSGSHAPRHDDARRRPMQLLRKPIPLTVVAATSPDAAQSSHELPALRVEGQLHRVAQSWGPERIETGWWDGPTIRRDYYRVETETGKVWWVFRALRTGDWFLHGRFV